MNIRIALKGKACYERAWCHLRKLVEDGGSCQRATIPTPMVVKAFMFSTR